MTLDEKARNMAAALTAVRLAERSLLTRADPSEAALGPGQAVALLQTARAYANVDGRIVELDLVLIQSHPAVHDMLMAIKARLDALLP